MTNPCKSEIGIISKKILEDINANVVRATGLTQWRYTEMVLEWFGNIQDKSHASF